MYLHIGKESVINSKNIIGIFNLDYIGNTKEYRGLEKRLNDEKKIICVSEKQNKTFILTQEGKKEKAYMTNIGVYTVAKRFI